MSTSTKPQTFAEITEDQVNQWKETFKNIYLIEVDLTEDPESSEKARFYAKPPSVKQMQIITEIANDKKGGAVMASDTMKSQVILGGDMEYLSSDCKDASVYLAVMEQVGDLVGKKKATLKQV